MKVKIEFDLDESQADSSLDTLVMDIEEMLPEGVTNFTWSNE